MSVKLPLACSYIYNNTVLMMNQGYLFITNLARMYLNSQTIDRQNDHKGSSTSPMLTPESITYQ